ncbi:MAG: hypothetical protein AB1782_16780 [Cyanobacteriota bacterium]
MYLEVLYYCPKCLEQKISRFGNKGLPEVSLRFQAEIQGIHCPTCGFHINNITTANYRIIDDNYI